VQRQLIKSLSGSSGLSGLSGLSGFFGLSGLSGPSEIGFAFHGINLSGLSGFFGFFGLSGFFGPSEIGFAFHGINLSGLFGPSEIGSPCSSFHTPQGRSHFTPYTALQGTPRTLSLQGRPRTLSLQGRPRTTSLQGRPRTLLLQGKRDKFIWLNDLMARMIGAIFMKLGRAPATNIIFIKESFGSLESL